MKHQVVLTKLQKELTDVKQQLATVTNAREKGKKLLIKLADQNKVYKRFVESQKKRAAKAKAKSPANTSNASPASASNSKLNSKAQTFVPTTAKKSAPAKVAAKMTKEQELRAKLAM